MSFPSLRQLSMALALVGLAAWASLSSESLAPAQPASVVAPLSSRPQAAPSSPPVTELVSRVSVTCDDPAGQAQAQQIAGWALALATRTPLADTIARVRSAGPQELLLMLERRLRTDPALASELVQALAREADPGAAFQLARALGPWLSDAGLRQETLVALAEQSPALRAAGLVALLGRSQPEVTSFLLGQLEGEDDPVVRGRSAVLLARVWPQLPPQAAERAGAAARAILAAPTSDPHAVSGAAELLARPDVPATDLDLLWARLETTQDPAAFSALVYGLCVGGSDLHVLQRELERLERRPGALRRHIALLRAVLSS